ncbi:hypothetical protein JK621_14410 [Serratia plymuthica]|uniref:hypothetical protein n=1 Tax=Serratia plymuthica TaxID=82996 RepID=UPI001BAF4D29|nr:hypothetical protein [Serratia plymuthica]QUY46652.1 hypothetical protein JK621_14410 [Serratia plymuthica]
MSNNGSCNWAAHAGLQETGVGGVKGSIRKVIIGREGYGDLGCQLASRRNDTQGNFFCVRVNLNAG